MELLKGIIRHKWSVREAERFVIAHKNTTGDKKAAARSAVKQENAFTKALGKKLGMSVKQKVMGRGGGQLIIAYKKSDDLEKVKNLFNL